MLFLILGVLLASVVALVLILEMRCYLRCMSYRKQGCLVYYRPFVPAMISRYLNGHRDGNSFKYINEDYKYAKSINSPIIGYNMTKCSCALVYLLDLGLIREFFAKEVEVSIKEPPVNFQMNCGFIFEGQNTGLEHRAIFAQFFRVENLNKLIPLVYETVKDLYSKLPLGPDGTLQFPESSRELVNKMMIRIVNSILFGNVEDVPKSKLGLSFSEEIVELFEILYSDKVLMNLWNQISRDQLNKLKLLKASREVSERTAYLSKTVIDHIENRAKTYQLGLVDRECNVVNMLIEHNLRAEPDQKLSPEDMVGSCNLFFLAAYDTTT